MAHLKGFLYMLPPLLNIYEIYMNPQGVQYVVKDPHFEA